MDAPKRYAVPVDVVSEALDGEAVILNLRSGRYFALNRTATRIWELLSESRDTGEVCETVAREYGTPIGRVEADLTELLGQLTARDLLRPE